jgi:arabinose-5-phosphate isomerase
MSKKGFGLTTVFNEQNLLEGVFTDGDLRRILGSGKDIRSTLIKDVMSTSYKSISSNALAAEAANIMQTSNVYVLIVKNDDDKIEGIIKMHDLLDANVV